MSHVDHSQVSELMFNYDRHARCLAEAPQFVFEVLMGIDMDNVSRVLVAGFLLFGAAMVLLALLGDYLVGIR